VNARNGFALGELVVLLALAGAAGALVVPAVQKARAADARARCAENLRLIGTGAKGYADAHTGTLPRDSTGQPRHGWNTEVLPFIGEEALAKKCALGSDWFAEGNRAFAQTRVAAFVCPAAPHPDRTVLTQHPDDATKNFRAAPTDYVGSAGAYYETTDQHNLHPGAMHHRKITERIRVTDIADGTSNTLLVVEMADKPNGWRAGKLAEERTDKPQNPALSGQWAAPNWNHLRSYSTDGKSQFGPCAVNCSNGASIYGFHDGGANALFVDGSVRFLRAGLSQELLVALVSIAGGEVLAPTDF